MSGLYDAATNEVRGPRVMTMFERMLASDGALAVGMQLKDPEVVAPAKPGTTAAVMESYEESRGGFTAEFLVSGEHKRNVPVKATGFLDGNEPVMTRVEAGLSQHRMLFDGSYVHLNDVAYGADVVDGVARPGTLTRDDGRDVSGTLMAAAGSFVVVEDDATVRPIIDVTREQASRLHAAITQASDSDSIARFSGRQRGLGEDGPMIIDAIGDLSSIHRDDMAMHDLHGVRELVRSYGIQAVGEKRFGTEYDEAFAYTGLADRARAAMAERGAVFPPLDRSDPIDLDGLSTTILVGDENPYRISLELGPDGSNAFSGILMHGVVRDGDSPESPVSHLVDVRVDRSGEVVVDQSRPRVAAYLATEAGRLYAVERETLETSEVVGGIDGADLRGIKQSVVALGGTAMASAPMVGVPGEGPVRMGVTEISPLPFDGRGDVLGMVHSLVEDFRAQEAGERGGIMSQAAAVTVERGSEEAAATAKGPEKGPSSWLDRLRSTVAGIGRD